MSKTNGQPLRFCDQRSSLLPGDRVARIAGAHDVLSAKLVERCGFDGVWASSLEIATARGKIDDDRLTMHDLFAVTESMASAVSIPVLADAGTGWGDRGDVADVVTAFESCGAAGICIEDMAWPKCNSLLDRSHALASPVEFADRVTRACQARRSDKFVIIARVEALVAGMGIDEALHRAGRYEKAGADAIVIHAKSSTLR